MSATTSTESGKETPSSPWVQAVRLAFIAFYVCTLIAAFQWLSSNVMEVNAGSGAVVIHMGAIKRDQSSGLLWAWPQPIDQVVVVPSAETVLERRIETLLRSQRAKIADEISYDDHEGGPVSDALAGSGYLMTGDGAVVQLEVQVYYKVIDPRAYVLQQDHITPALERLTTGSAIAICAGRDLDQILVARPELVALGNVDAKEREKLRNDLLVEINRRLDDLRTNQVELGIQALRVDVQSSLPRDTLNAFNAVLTASQRAERALADARSDAARIIQTANQAADRSLQVANALASERIAKAQADTASIFSLTESVNQQTEPGLLMRIYRERLPDILKSAGAITTIEPQTTPQFVIPGRERAR